MRAEAAAEIVVPALAEQMQVDVAEQQREGVRILAVAVDRAGVDTEHVGRVAGVDEALEQPGRMDALERAERVAARPVEHRDALRIGLEAADQQPVRHFVRAEHGERVTVTRLHDRLDGGGIGRIVVHAGAASARAARRPRIACSPWTGMPSQLGRFAAS
jgi:hypothetical protein